ncbi:MAG: hypothetical protein LBO65_03185 [Spirochaetaceae bacterium]|jgi:hypothetical protein|nr:hypothetical protein [Spirochaetaceae bacterium]
MKKRFFLGITLGTLLIPGLMAQTAGSIASTSIRSMKYNATGGLWGNTMDDAQDVNDYQDVEFDKFFAFLAGGTGAGEAPYISGGFAKNFGGIYLGLSYTGSLVSGTGIETTNAAGDRADPATGTGSDTGFTVTDRIYGLIGTPVGGFKLGVLSNFRSDEDENEGSYGTRTEKDGRLGLSLIWGKNFDLGPGILKPEAGILYGFNLAETEITGAGGNSQTTRTGYAPLQLMLRGDYVFPRNGAAQSALSFTNVFEYHIFPDPAQENSFNDTVSRRTGKEWNNTVTLGFKRTYEVDERFSVAWNLGGRFYYSSANTDQETENPDVKVKGGTFAYFFLIPEAKLGFIYQFVPGTFALHGYAGAEFTVSHIKESSNRDNDKSSTAITQVGGIAPSVGLGGTLQFHPMAALDFALSASTSAGAFSISPNARVSVIIKN